MARVHTLDALRRGGISQLTYGKHNYTVAGPDFESIKYLLWALAENVHSFYGCQPAVLGTEGD